MFYANNMKVKRRMWVKIAAVAVVSMLVAGLAIDLSGPLRLVAVAPTSSTTPAPTPAPALDPIQIEAMRARSYPGSQLIITQDLGAQFGYHDSIASYLSDGLTLYALVSTPNGAEPAGGWPVIILAHGYIDPPQYQTAGADYRSVIDELAAAGYLVVKPDYRGHGHSQGQPTGGHFSPAYTYDVLNLIASLKTYSDANPERIGLLGHSLGGHVALRTIVVSHDVKATVFMAGVVGSINDILYNWPRSPAPGDRPVALVQGARQRLIAIYGDPKTNPKFWDSASAINYVSAVSGAVQINHDEADSTVPKLFSDHLNAALVAAHKPADYFVYPGDDHQFTQNHALLMQRILAFYAAHL